MEVNIYVPLMTDKQFEKLCKHLVKKCKFGEMPELLWIEGSNKPRVKNEAIWRCDNTLKHTLAWLVKHNISNIRTNIEKLYDLGAHCDCEVLFNAASKWRDERHADITGPEYMDDGWIEWEERIDNVLLSAYYTANIKSIPGWTPETVYKRDDQIKQAVNALKNRHVIVDVDDVVEELAKEGIKISRNYIAGELDANCPVQRHLLIER